MCIVWLRVGICHTNCVAVFNSMQWKVYFLSLKSTKLVSSHGISVESTKLQVHMSCAVFAKDIAKQKQPVAVKKVLPSKVESIL